jgi:signal transduction histidine kinase
LQGTGIYLNSELTSCLKRKNERIKRANRQLKESEASLKVINATKDKFFSIVSHDLKNPFTSLLSISEMFKDSYDSLEDDERKDSIGRIHNSMKHIYNLLENLLTWSRAQSNRIQFNPANFNLSKVLQENYNLYSLAAEKKKIKLEAHFNDDIMAFGDREMINTVVRNLLNNALKFTPTGKKGLPGSENK